MAPASDCPTDLQLERARTGRLSGDEAPQVELHLLTCETCGARIAELEARDGESNGIGSSAAIAKSEGSSRRVQELVDRLYLWPAREAERARAGGTTPRILGRTTEAGSPAGAAAGFSSFPRQFGDYELLKEIARGGMGVVYKARQRGLDRLVAVKMIISGELADAAAVERFRTEARAAAQLRHAGIVAVYEVGEHEGRHFFSMEFVDGRNLAEESRVRPPTAEAAAKCVAAIAEAVQYAHEHGVLHRDLKPSNVLIDGEGRPHVTDFGLAKRMSEPSTGVTRTHDILGSPGYMPPEQASGRLRDPGPHSDVYSLGAILYDLLTGRPPFRGETPLETVLEALHREPIRPRLLNPKTPRDLETICLKCLEKNPARRYASARQMADELGRFLRNEPILARPIGRAARAWRWCRRRPVTAAWIALVLAVVTLLAMGGPVVAMREATLKEHARRQEHVAKMAAEAATTEREKARAAEKRANEQRAIAERESTEAKRQARIAEARRLAIMARVERETHPTRGLLLALEAARRVPPNAEDASVSAENELRESLRRCGGWPLVGHEKDVTCLAISEKGQWLATGSADRTVRLWNLSASDPASAPRVVRTPENTVRKLAICPQGRWLVTTGSSNRLWLWDLSAAGESMPRELRGHATFVATLEISSDGRWLASGGGDAHVLLWDLTAEDPGANPHKLPGHNRETDLKFSIDAKWLVTTSGDIIRRWDLTAEKPETTVKSQRGHKAGTTNLDLSPDGRWLAASGSDKIVRLFDLHAPEGAVISTVLPGHERDILSVAFSPNGRLLATSGLDKTIRLWDISTGNPAANSRMLRGHEGAVFSVAISPDGRWLVTAAGDKTSRVWDLSQPDPGVSPRVLTGHDGLISHLAISPDGHWLVTAGQEPTPRLWDLTARDAAANPRILRLGDHDRFPAAVDITGHWLATAGVDKTIRLRESKTLASGENSRVLSGHAESTSSLWFSGDGRWLAASGVDKSVASNYGVRLFETSAAAESGPRAVFPAPAWLEAVAMSSNGRWLAAGGRDKLVRLWNLAESQRSDKPYLLRSHERAMFGLAFSADERWLATASLDRTAPAGADHSIRLWDLSADDPAAKPRVLAGHISTVSALAFAPNGRWLASAGMDLAPRLWDLTSADPAADPLVLPGHELGVFTLAVSPDSRWLATGSYDKTVRLWDLFAGDPAASTRVLRGHESGITKVAFDAGGRWLASAGGDGIIRLWDLAAVDPGASPRLLTGLGGVVVALGINNEDKSLAAASGDALCRWDLDLSRLTALASAVAGRSLTEAERRLFRLANDAVATSPRAEIRDVLPAWPTNASWHRRLADESRAAGNTFAAEFHEAALLRQADR